MKIAIYGGAFNPPHNGHIHLALSLNEKYHFDRIFLIPTGNPAHKSSKDFASDEDRLNMCSIIANEYPIFEVLDIEIQSKSKSYTYNTVKKLKALFTGNEFYLIIGGDMLEMFDEWYEYKKLSKAVTILCAAREDNFQILEKKQKELLNNGCKIKLENIPILEVSSSEIRQKLKSNQTVNKLLPDAVLEYIKDKKIYVH